MNAAALMNNMNETKGTAPVLETIEAEQQLIGAVFINNDAFHLVSSFLKPEHFSDPFHAHVWQLITEQIEAGQVATPITLKPFIEKVMIGDMPAYHYLVRTATEAVGVVSAKSFGQVINDMAARRSLIAIADKMKEKAINAEPSAPAKGLLVELENELNTLIDDVTPETDDGTAARVVDNLLEQFSNKIVLPTIPLPLQEIHDVLSGDLEAGNLYGLLSSSGEGKTSLALQIMDFAAKNGHPVYFMSYDQSEQQCILQIASQRTGIEGSRIRNQEQLTKADKERLFRELMDIRKLPLKVKNCTNENINQLSSYVRRFLKWNRSDKTPLIVVDHVRKIQPIIAGTYEGRVASEIGGASKAMAKEHNLVWLNIMQRKSMREGRENPHPIDQDLFGGEQAKEDYDAILYLYRPEKYRDMRLTKANTEKKRDEILRYLENWSGKSKIGALKVRFGDASVARSLDFQAEFTRYSSVIKPDQEAFEGLF